MLTNFRLLLKNRLIDSFLTMRRKKKLDVKKKSGSVNDDRQKTHYEDIKPENKNFEAYYKLQKICPEEEWDSFMKCLRNQLPSSFRITNSKCEAKSLLELIKGQYFKNVLNASRKEEHEWIEPVAIPWYPNNLAWQIQLTRKAIRHCEALWELHNFLISETESGNITRQEVVSMIPPIVLDVKPHHKVLDMCASPGSKTAQLIESLHINDRIPEGFIIANDVDNSRCYMLVRQLKRLNSTNILVTNHDASTMPNFIIKNNGVEKNLKFDRILCDVPCTGDGTLRKNPIIWPKWSASHGINFHGKQFRIAKRGCEMLAIGGRLVYSTCSLNPMENESVILRLLSEAKGSLKLIDFTSNLPGLKFEKGLTKWTPTTNDLATYENYEDVPEKYKSILRPYMFPPSEEVAKGYNIERCIRILPHHQDTGGFFVAAIEKVAALPWESSRTVEEPTDEVKNNDVKKTESSEPPRKKRKMQGYNENPFVFFVDDDPLWNQIKDFYDISNDLQGRWLLTRCREGKKNNIYLTSPNLREIIMNNADRIKIINSGVKVFARCENRNITCPFRLVQEGLQSIYPYVGQKRKVSVTKEDLLIILSNQSNREKPPEIARLNPATQIKMKEIGQGNCIFVYDEEPITDSSLHLKLAGWLGVMSVNIYIPICDVVHYLRLLGGDTSKFDLKKFRKAENQDDKGESSQLTTENVD